MAGARTDSLESLYGAFPALLGRDATADERRAFERYADLLLHWNRTHHLTSLRTRGAIAQGLFLDSLYFRALFPAGPRHVVDIGAGAGIPGVPLRIVDPHMSLTLVESRRKPVSFLRTLVAEMRLSNISVLHGRAENLVTELPDLVGGFDLALTRAVGLSRALVESAMTYLKTEGRLIAAGPPPKARRPDIDWDGPMEWKDIYFESMRTTRTFLVCSKGS